MPKWSVVSFELLFLLEPQELTSHGRNLNSRVIKATSKGEARSKPQV